MKIFLYILITLITANSLSAAVDTTFKVDASISACPAMSIFNERRVSEIENTPSFGFGFFGEVMWHPGRNFAVGIMSGYMQISNDEIDGEEEGRANLSAVPLQVMLSLRFKKLELSMGMGPYILLSRVDYMGKANSYRFELAVTSILSYGFELNNNIDIAMEARVVYLSFRKVLSLMPAINLKYTFYWY